MYKPNKFYLKQYLLSSTYQIYKQKIIFDNCKNNNINNENK